MKRSFYLFLSLSLLFVACNGEEETKPENTTGGEEYQQVENPFEDTLKPFTEERRVLLELGICDTVETEECVACLPKHFALTKINPDKSIADGFVLQIKANLKVKGGAKPYPRLMVYERAGDDLVLVNEFNSAILNSNVKSGSDYDDLIIAFYNELEQVHYYCRFNWNKGKYKFSEVEKIDVGNDEMWVVKESLRDSISDVLYTELVERRQIIL